ncbi:MAG: tetratricopeptide repeat protein [Pirellulales bacterium]
MMARKLSVVVRSLAAIALASVWLNELPCAIAQTRTQVTAPTGTFANPFVAEGARPHVVVPEPADALRGPTTYQNPFAGASKAPPIDNSIRPGPISRWQRPTIARSPSSDVKTAVLSPESLEAGLTGATQSPAHKSLLENIGSDQIIRSTPNALTQPASIDAGPASAISTPTASSPASAASGLAIPDPAAFITDQAMLPPAIAFGGSSITAKDLHADIAAVVANCDDTPEGWLAQAQEAAKTAASVEQLANIITLCDRGLQHTPSSQTMASLRRLSAWAHNRHGELLADSAHPDAAIQDFQVAISMDPTCSLAIHNRAVTLAQRNQYGAALRDFNRVIELNPGLAVAYRNRAELLAALGRMEEAIADYDQAIASLPDDAALLRSRAHAHQRVGDFASAAVDINQALQIAPNDPDTITLRGNLAAEQGRFEKAGEDFERALAIDANWAEALRSLAWLRATCPDQRFRDAEKALEAAQHAAKLAPTEDYRMLDTLAAANACGKHFDKAVELQKRAVETAPRDLSTPLAERLAMYERNQSYVATSPHSDVRTVSHEEPAAKQSSRQAAKPKTSR